MSAHGAPVRSRQKIPFKTLRQSTASRRKPWSAMMAQSPITQNPSNQTAPSQSPLWEIESDRSRFWNPIYGYVI
jgi:hypothetical protein